MIPDAIRRATEANWEDAKKFRDDIHSLWSYAKGTLSGARTEENARLRWEIMCEWHRKVERVHSYVKNFPPYRHFHDILSQDTDWTDSSGTTITADRFEEFRLRCAHEVGNSVKGLHFFSAKAGKIPKRSRENRGGSDVSKQDVIDSYALFKEWEKTLLSIFKEIIKKYKPSSVYKLLGLR